MIPPVASRFVAGTTAEAALAHTREVNERGVASILNLLGEHYDDRAAADEDARAYLDLIGRIESTDARACVSVKPSQLGLDVGPDAFEENLATIAARADGAGVFLWIDMEDHTTVDHTLDAFERLNRRHDGMGVCLQANLRRTGDDLRRLADLPGKVRLVKGAYDEPPSVAYRDGARVDEQYRSHLESLFREWDDGIAVGSHDPAMLDLATDLHAEYGTGFEVQMLMGVREDAQYRLAADYPVFQYVPYGSKWPAYFYRRLRERKENLLFALRAVLGR